ncbi:MAG: biotin--[acetyl-CoA-carboxylase] ligase [Candidatus Izemoplasmatales bacterium]|jgi:biotin-[acetyl-CoA-carboxylase] ligase BirA-like protein|nr:biotin--[acetyl-CoA-carboxylase] ligase [Candidatus Izemoplasmatales bacterium]
MIEHLLFNHILYFQSLESTNDFIKSNFSSLENHTVVLAGYQTNGKGQFERIWESQPNLNLLFSILFTEDLDPILMNEIIVKSIGETLDHFSIHSWYKEPNDVYVDDLKISGVLMETKYTDNRRDFLVIGIGLNINQQYFTVSSATSMALVLGHAINKQEVFDVFLSIFEINYRFMMKDDE